MNIKIAKSDIIWSYLGYILKFCSGFFLLPLLLVKLSSDELGVWYVFLSIGALIQLLDLGFSPTIMRNISYAFAGANTLQAEGISQQELTGKPNYELIAKLLNISRKIYLIIASCALLLLLIFGSVYIYDITKSIENTDILIAWVIYAFGIFFNFFYSYWVPILIGVGKIKESQKATILSQIAYLGIAFIGLTYSWGLIAVSIAFLCSGFILRFFCRYYFRAYVEFPHVVIEKQEMKILFQNVWYNAKKMGIVSFGAFLIVQANTLICSSFFALNIVASFGLTLQVINVLISFSRVLFSTYLPVINEARMKQDIEKLKREMSKTFVLGWIVYFVGALVILLWGNDILKLMHSKTLLLENSMTGLILLYLFLEFNHSNFATIITTKNEIPFVGASIFSGLGVVIVALINILYFNLGIWGMLLAQFIVQLAYNNWYWPVYVMRDLNMGVNDILHLGFDGVCLMVKKEHK